MEEPRKLGLAGITAVVFGSMIGSGIFNIAQNMAVSAQVGAVAISWVITAVGMLCLVYTFKVLNSLRPDLDAGIYEYAQVGFGNYAGFNIAWGYWICTACGNVAYAVMLNDACGVFFPVLLRHGWATVVFDSALIWVMYLVVIRGIHSASLLNNLLTALKLLCLVMIAGVMVSCFDTALFTSDIWGMGEGIGVPGDQIKNTMLITLWCFVGIEGAVVMAARAKRASDVGKAGIIGFLLAWLIYTVVSLLCYGVMPRAEMAGLENPSVAYVMRAIGGEWAYYFVVVAVILALLGGWVAWTMMCSQVPYEASTVGIMPKAFNRLNSSGVPAYGLFVSTLMMQVLILIVVSADSVYMAAISITSMMVLPAYLFSGLFLWYATYYPGRLLRVRTEKPIGRYRLIGILCTVNCLWLLYAGGIDLLLCTSLCYLPGTYFYVKARREAAPGTPAFTSVERSAMWLMVVACIVAVWLVATHPVL